MAINLRKRNEQPEELSTAQVDANWSAIEEEFKRLAEAQATATIENEYSDIDDMLSNQNEQSTGALQYVEDASDDPTVANGYAYYEKKSVSTQILANYRKLTNEEQEDIETGVQKVLDQNGNVLEAALKVVYGEGFTISPVPGGGYKVVFESTNIPPAKEDEVTAIKILKRGVYANYDTPSTAASFTAGTVEAFGWHRQLISTTGKTDFPSYPGTWKLQIGNEFEADTIFEVFIEEVNGQVHYFFLKANV